jgi:hypothetical protein
MLLAGQLAVYYQRPIEETPIKQIWGCHPCRSGAQRNEERGPRECEAPKTNKVPGQHFTTLGLLGMTCT